MVHLMNFIINTSAYFKLVLNIALSNKILLIKEYSTVIQDAF